MDTLQADVDIIFAKNDPSLGFEGAFQARESAFVRLWEHLASNGHVNTELRMSLNQIIKNRADANAHSHWMNPDLSWLRGVNDWILSTREWLTSLGYAPSEEHAPMDGIELRPDYEPGDVEFEADAIIIKPPSLKIIVDGNDAVPYLLRVANAAIRQAMYWRKQGQTTAPQTAEKAKPSKPTYQGYAVNTATFGHGMFVQVVFESDDVRRGRLYQDAKDMAMQPTHIIVQEAGANRFAVEFRIDDGADVARGILQRMLIEMKV